jgi:hypothetical protein
MARKLPHSERQIFEEIIREADPSSLEISPEKFLRRLEEQQQAISQSNSLALWLREDPLNQP